MRIQRASQTVSMFVRYMIPSHLQALPTGIDVIECHNTLAWADHSPAPCRKSVNPEYQPAGSAIRTVTPGAQRHTSRIQASRAEETRTQGNLGCEWRTNRLREFCDCRERGRPVERSIAGGAISAVDQ